MKIPIYSALCAIALFLACSLEETDPCQETDADDINVSFRVVAYNVNTAVQGAVYSVQSEKHPCGADPKGQFDIKGLIDSNGTYESYMTVNYNLRNTADKIIFTYWFNGIGSGTITVTYAMAKPYDGSTYYVRVNYPSAELQSLHDQYESNPENFRQCQDLAWAVVTGTPDDSGKASKTALYDSLKSKGYVDIEQGVVPEGTGSVPTIDFADGDIVMLSFENPPGTETNPTANHYAVVYGGKLYQILNWPQGGDFDGPNDFADFFSPRTLTNPFTDETTNYPRVYQYYKVWRKAATP